MNLGQPSPIQQFSLTRRPKNKITSFTFLEQVVATNNHFPLLQRPSDWMRIGEDLVNLLQGPPFGLDKSEIDSDDPQGINKEAKKIELPVSTRHPDWCSVGVDEGDDV